MNEMLFHRYVAPFLWAAGSIGAGFALGTSTVHGMETDRYGYRATQAYAPSPDSNAGPGLTLASGTASPTQDEACDGCSERDLGYRWAMLRRIVAIGDCPNDSWDFRRGCAAYARDMMGS
jgi:hypothetical protein